MKTLNRILILAVFAFALTSCSDNGPVSVSDKDGRTIQSTVVQDVVSSQQVPDYSEWEDIYIWEGEGTESLKCDKEGEGEEGQRPPSGWMHFLFNNKGESTDAVLVLSRGDDILGEFTPQAPFDSNNWHFYTPFFEIFDEDGEWTLAAKVYLNGEGATPKKVVLSDYCPGDDATGESASLLVSKTVETYYIRTHEWSIEKSVDTEKGFLLDEYAKIWLFIDGSGNEEATWTVDVTYEGFEDSGWNVSGVITIQNIGDEAKGIESVIDELDGNEIVISCAVDGSDITFPYTLAVATSITCMYDADGFVTGDNVVTVTVHESEEDLFSPYVYTKEIVWGDPDTEVNETVTIKDISDLFGEADLGTATAPNHANFSYDREFKWEDYGADDCGGFKYDNTAMIVETEQEADASLKVNVQCYVYESAWALDMKDEVIDVFSFCDNGFNNWGWSNLMGAGAYTLDLYAGAGQCDISKGTYVGYVEINYNGGFSFNYHIEPDYYFKESHVYAGSTMFPQQRRGRGWADTVAPGQYYIDDPLSGNIYVIAHGVVGLPDPDFGPIE